MAPPDAPVGRGGRAPAPVRARQWGAWLDPELTRRGLRNTDLEKLLDNRYDSGLISHWRTGKAAPAELAAWEVAEVLHLPVPDVLRHAGFADMAEKVERVAARGAQPAPTDRVAELLETVGDPELTSPLMQEFLREFAAAQRRVELEVAELHRKQQETSGEPDAASR